MSDAQLHHDFLWGWDPTPGIVSVWAESSGQVTVWRRDVRTGALHRDDARFRPWLLIDRLDDLAHLGERLAPEGTPGAHVHYRELDGPGALRFHVSAADERIISSALLQGATQRLGRRVTSLRELGDETMLVLPPDEQYLVSTGRTYFRDMGFDLLQRMQFDLETTGLDPSRDRIFMIAVRRPDGGTETLEAQGEDDAAEAELLLRLEASIRDADPDVIENHNLHGFDLPFVERRSRRLGLRLTLGRTGGPGLRQRGARRGVASDYDPARRVRFVAPGRELIDTLDAVRRHDVGARELPGHGLKAVARHFGFAGPEREYIRGDQIHATFRRDPERVRRYATDDVVEVAELARLLGGPAFALARMAPRRYERLADTGAATGVIDPMLVRAYVRAGQALPARVPSDGTPHTGAALHLFATGVARRVVKADVASLYPSLMRAYRIGPARDHLGAMLALVDGLVEQRLAAKASGRAAPPGSSQRHAHEAMSAAMKIVVNSAYGYLGAGGELTRFADVHAANEVTRRGRETLELMCRELAARGVTLLEADTDGVYFAVPGSWSEADERRVVREVAALLPPLVRAAWVDAVIALRRRLVSTHDVSSRVRLTRSPAEYLAVRESRRELPYEALLSSGRTDWHAGDRVRVYRTAGGAGALVEEAEHAGPDTEDRRDYDVEHYARVLRNNYASRLARAFTPEDLSTLLADPVQPSLFDPPVASIRTVLTPGAGASAIAQREQAG